MKLEFLELDSGGGRRRRGEERREKVRRERRERRDGMKDPERKRGRRGQDRLGVVSIAL